MRYALCLEYDGSRFLGWQTQRQQPTVQDSVQAALAEVAGHPVTVTCAGRTDTGVHALAQVVHFDSPAERSERSWVLGCNTRLAAGITALWIRPVGRHFNARFSATSRAYRYLILNRWVRPALALNRVAWIKQPLDEVRMAEAAGALVGEHDFSAFRAAGCQSNHAIRELSEIDVRRDDDTVVMDVRANGFLYHMVRNIAGSLIEVGQGKYPPGWIRDVLESRDRTRAGITAPAAGLYFLGPRYPAEFDLPAFPAAPFPRARDKS